MMKDGIINVRVSKRIREEAENTLKLYGISMSEAVNMLLHQIIAHGGLPFELKPTEATLKALHGMRKDGGEGGYTKLANIDELFQ